MAYIGWFGLGVGLLIFAGIGYFAPTSPEGYTYPQLDGLCSSGFFQVGYMTYLGKLFYGENYQETIEQECANIRIITIAIYAIALGGIFALIHSWFMPGEKKEDEHIKKDETSLEILKKRLAKGEITTEEFEELKKKLE